MLPKSTSYKTSAILLLVWSKRNERRPYFRHNSEMFSEDAVISFASQVPFSLKKENFRIVKGKSRFLFAFGWHTSQHVRAAEQYPWFFQPPVQQGAALVPLSARASLFIHATLRGLLSTFWCPKLRSGVISLNHNVRSSFGRQVSLSSLPRMPLTTQS